MFPNKHRPKGLEFPACKTCNAQTSADEALAGFFARVTGNHRFEVVLADDALQQAITAVGWSFPNLLARVVRRQWVRYNGILQRKLTVNGNDAMIARSVCRVAAKLGLAAYYEHNKRCAPPTVKINTMWTHNQNQNTNLAVDNLLKSMPNSRFLKQGKRWDTQGTFFFRYYAEDDEFMSAAILHESLALMAHITPADNTKSWSPWHHVWAPVPEKGIQPFSAPRALALIV